MKILFILSRFPYPLEKGDKLRAYQHIVNLKASGHEVHLVAISDQEVKPVSMEKIQALCSTVSVLRLNYFSIFFNLVASLFRSLPLQVGYFYSTRHQDQINEIISRVQPGLVYCQLIRTALFVRNHTTIPRVIDYQDAFSKGTSQRMSTTSWWLKPLFKRELRLVKEFERASYNWFNGHMIISPQDRDALAVPPGKPVTIVPNGVDTSFYFPWPAPKNTDIIFVGNMNYPPNVDGACYLVEEIMPLVWKKFPGASVRIAGANPNRKVRGLSAKRVEITGWVEDIRDSYRSAGIFVAPMRIGTGLQNKLLEAMAMGIPCVTTPISFEPLGAKQGHDILVGKNAIELAEQICRLLANDGLKNEIGNNSLKFVVENYSMQHSRALLEKVLQNAFENFKIT